MGNAWDMRSNIKGKPASQGTLFQLRDKSMLNPDQRWPKGYTPERQAAVNEHLHGANSPYLLSNNAVTGPARRELNEGIKRSTVPPEHLEGVRFAPGQQSLAVFGNGPNTEVQGVYEQHVDPEPRISILHGHEDSYVPIHEIGHHVSKTEATTHSEYRTGSQRGQEEGFADQYAYEHFRDRRGERMQQLRYYPTPNHPDASHRANFAMAYGTARSTIPVSDVLSFRSSQTPKQRQFSEGKDAEHRGETLFTTWDNGDDTVTFHAPPKEQWGVGEPIGHTPKGRRPQ